MDEMLKAVFSTSFAYSMLRVTTPILFAALGAVVYNWVVRWTGGIEVELEPREHQLQPGGPTPLAPPPQTPAP